MMMMMMWVRGRRGEWVEEELRMELNCRVKSTPGFMHLQEKGAFVKNTYNLLHVKGRKEIYFLVGGWGGRKIYYSGSLQGKRQRAFCLKIMRKEQEDSEISEARNTNWRAEAKHLSRRNRQNLGWSMGCASSIHISDRVVYHSGKDSEDSHSPQQTNANQQQGNPSLGLPIKSSSYKVSHNTLTRSRSEKWWCAPVRMCDSYVPWMCYGQPTIVIVMHN